MKAVIRLSDRVVFYLRPESERVVINQYGLLYGRRRAVDIAADTHEVVEGVAPPSQFVPGAMTWNGEWAIPDRELFDSLLNLDPSYIAEKKAEAENLSAKVVLKEQMAAKLDDLSDNDLATVTYLYDEWSGDAVTYGPGDIRRFNGVLWRYIGADPTQSQPSWNPADAPSLWERVRQPLAPWVQPGTVLPEGGVQPAYDLDALVTHDNPNDGGALWEYRSKIAANTTEPGRDSTFDRYWEPVRRA
jgi:hypothetical protein